MSDRAALAGLAGDAVTALVTDFGNKTWRYGVQDQVNAVRKTDDSRERFERYKAESDAAETALLAVIASIQARVPVVTDEIVDQLVAEFTTAANPNWILGNYGTVSTLLRRFLELTTLKEAARDES